MINNLEIENFKNIKHQYFKFKPLTILTGVNSTGKSSVIQAILLLTKSSTTIKKELISALVSHYTNFSDIRNKYTNAKELKISINQLQQLLINVDKAEFISNDNTQILNYEQTVYYISANRIGQEQIAILNEEQKIGKTGEYIFGYFEQNKDKALDEAVVKFIEQGYTLKAQVNAWLSYIVDLPIQIITEKITSTHVKIAFNSDGIDNINPFNLGAGNSYLVKILIIALLCEKNNILLIENPEIHLHPKAQARLGEFFAWMANSGIQVIIETHSEHLINKVKYQIYTSQLNSDEAVIYYKPSIQEEFIPLWINQNGKFINEDKELIMFPSGFFDSTLKELLEIG